MTWSKNCWPMASFRVEVASQARDEIRRLPGNLRQRVIRSLRSLEQEPHPHTSRPLDLIRAGVTLGTGIELRRMRLASWRIIYLIDETDSLITVLAVRKR